MRFLIFLAPFFALLYERSFFHEAYEVRVLKVYDGDTVLVGFGPIQEKLRFVLLDAPELSQSGVGKFSQDCLKKLIKKQKTHLMLVGHRDQYGRILGSLKGVSEEMAQRGCSGLYPFAQFKSVHEKMNYLRWIQKAKKEHLGIWNYPGFLQPYVWRKLNKRNVHQRRS